MRTIKRIAIHKATAKRYLIKDLTESFHTPYGTIPKVQLKKEGTITTDKKQLFHILKPHFTDLHSNLKRGPQIIQHKDLGLIIAKTGINHQSTIVDAGAGSGSLSLALANIAKHVTTYDINPEHLDIVQHNAKVLQVKNITIKQQNIYHAIDEKNLDLITLDVPEPWQVIAHAQTSLKPGGFLVIYLPNLTQVQTFLKACPMQVELITELLQRDWKIQGRVMRPEFQMLGHTGFLIFCRNL